MIGLFFVAAFAIAAAVSYSVTPCVRRLATHVGMLDVVDERRMHEAPKPRIGGIAVYLGFSAALFAILGAALKFAPFYHDPHDIRTFLGLLFGSTLILCVGIWDDVMGMRSKTKFFAQIVVALISMIYGFVIQGVQDPLHPGNWIGFPAFVGIPLTLMWYLGMMNAINFIDGLDGLLSGVTAIIGLFLFATVVSHGHLVESLVLCSLVGGALGFLPHNYNPAKIILGDSGALFIGYVFATVSIITTAKVAVTISLLVPMIALALPILDTAAAIVRRAIAGKRITEADRGHFHHVLVFRYGLGVKQAVLLIYAVCFILGAAAFVISGGVVVHAGRLAGAL